MGNPLLRLKNARKKRAKLFLQRQVPSVATQESCRVFDAQGSETSSLQRTIQQLDEFLAVTRALEGFQSVFRKASGMHIIRDELEKAKAGLEEDGILALLNPNPREQVSALTRYIGEDAAYAAFFVSLELVLLVTLPSTFSDIDTKSSSVYFWFLLGASFCHSACALIAVVWAATSHRLARDSDVLKTLFVGDPITVMANTFWTLGIIFLYCGLYPAFVSNFGVGHGSAGFAFVSAALLVVWRQCDLVKHERNVRTYWRDQKARRNITTASQTEGLTRSDPFDVTIGTHRINVLAELAHLFACKGIYGDGHVSIPKLMGDSAPTTVSKVAEQVYLSALMQAALFDSVTEKQADAV